MVTWNGSVEIFQINLFCGEDSEIELEAMLPSKNENLHSSNEWFCISSLHTLAYHK